MSNEFEHLLRKAQAESQAADDKARNDAEAAAREQSRALDEQESKIRANAQDFINAVRMRGIQPQPTYRVRRETPRRAFWQWLDECPNIEKAGQQGWFMPDFLMRIDLDSDGYHPNDRPIYLSTFVLEDGSIYHYHLVTSDGTPAARTDDETFVVLREPLNLRGYTRFDDSSLSEMADKAKFAAATAKLLAKG